jgi:TolB-like protein/DNA-binding winged helix-turn-helix (wHTH) protein/Tfp pilus assembly protein PilF
VGDSTAEKFQFDEFTLDQSRYLLQRGDWPVRLEKRPMELLILLLEREGNLVTREEIASHLWGKGVFLDVDHSINTAVRKVRRALRDDSDKPRFIETVVGKGYRFAAPITVSNGSDSAASSVSIVSPPTAAAPRKAAVSPALLACVAGALVLFLAVAALLYRRGTPDRAAGPPIRSLAVLPFKNVSGDPQQEYFAEGMTEATIDRLSHIPGLRVISPASTMRLKNTTLSVPEVARALTVDGVVQGSFFHQGSRVRVSLQLMRGKTGELIWAQDYDRQSSALPGLQEQIARTIAERIQVPAPQQQLVSAERSTVDPDVEENYLKGRYYFNKRTADDLNKSIGYFQQAVLKDPNYAYAYSGMADAYALLGFRGVYPAKDALANAKTAASRALQLDSTLAEPHASLAMIAEMYEWDWSKAEREYKRALELDLGNATIHHLYAGYLVYVGRFDEGIAEASLARDLDPLSLPVNNALAGRLLVAGRVHDAIEQVRKTLELSPYFAPAHQTLGWAYLRSGKPDDALREFQQAVQLAGADDTNLRLDLGFAYASVGKTQEARKILADFLRLHQQQRVPSAPIAILYGVLGQRDKAFAWLEKAFQERDPELTYLKVPGRRYEPLRHDPRFQQFVHRIGLPQ